MTRVVHTIFRKNPNLWRLLPLPSGDAHSIRSLLLGPAFLFPFWRVKMISTISDSTESRLTGRSVPLSGLVRLRTMGPLQKLGWREPGFLPESTQSSQRLSHLDVTQLSGIMRFPSHYTQKGSARFPPNPLTRVLSLLSYPELLTYPAFSPYLILSQSSAKHTNRWGDNIRWWRIATIY